MNICQFFEPYLWTLFNEYLPVFWTLFVNCIRWISAGFLDLICELYSMNICRFFEPYLWTLFDEYLPVFWTLFVSCIDKKKIKLKKPADSMDICRFFWTLFRNCLYSKNGRFMTLFDEYLPVFEPYLWTVFIRWISAGFLNLICIGEYSSQIRFKKPVDSWLVFIRWISQNFREKHR